MYESVGLYPAESFFQVNATTGVINIIQSLKQDGFARTDYTVSGHSLVLEGDFFKIVQAKVYQGQNKHIHIKKGNS